jgi:hypothetical protein
VGSRYTAELTVVVELLSPLPEDRVVDRYMTNYQYRGLEHFLNRRIFKALITKATPSPHKWEPAVKKKKQKEKELTSPLLEYKKLMKRLPAV